MYYERSFMRSSQSGAAAEVFSNQDLVALILHLGALDPWRLCSVARVSPTLHSVIVHSDDLLRLALTRCNYITMTAASGFLALPCPILFEGSRSHVRRRDGLYWRSCSREQLLQLLDAHGGAQGRKVRMAVRLARGLKVFYAPRPDWRLDR